MTYPPQHRRPDGRATDRTSDISLAFGGGRDRGASDVIGFVLVFSLVVIVVGLVAIPGVSALQSARDAEGVNNAERAMEVLADNAADLTERGAPSRATEIRLSDAQLYLDDPITVEVRGDDGDTAFEEEYTIRPVVYSGPDRTDLVSVMGAVFRVEPDGGVAVRDWSPVLQSDRAMIPVLNTSSTTGGAQSLDSSTALVRMETLERNVSVAATDWDHAFRLRVDSPRAPLWKRMLERDDDVSCSVTGDLVECDVTATPERLFVVETRVDVAITR